MWIKVKMMKAVQIILDKALLEATDEALLHTKQNRSEFVRDALREHLDRLEMLRKEAADRTGYERKSRGAKESEVWEKEASWPVE